MSVHSRSDRFDIGTGEVDFARIIGGVRYDTVRATLVADRSGLDKIDPYELRRLYRAGHVNLLRITMRPSFD